MQKFPRHCTPDVCPVQTRDKGKPASGYFAGSRGSLKKGLILVFEYKDVLERSHFAFKTYKLH